MRKVNLIIAIAIATFFIMLYSFSVNACPKAKYVYYGRTAHAINEPRHCRFDYKGHQPMKAGKTKHGCRYCHHWCVKVEKLTSRRAADSISKLKRKQ